MSKMVRDFIVRLVEREAARLIAWSTMTATAVVLILADHFNLTLSTEFVAGIGVFVGLAVTEIIRQLVFSLNTVERLTGEAQQFEQDGP